MEEHAYRSSDLFWNQAEEEVEFTTVVSSLNEGCSDIESCRRLEVIDGIALEMLLLLYKISNQIFSGNLWNIEYLVAVKICRSDTDWKCS